jgi:hypothetical protein
VKRQLSAVALTVGFGLGRSKMLYLSTENDGSLAKVNVEAADRELIMIQLRKSKPGGCITMSFDVIYLGFYD